MSNNCCGFWGLPKINKSCCQNDAKNYWVQGSGSFDPNNPFDGWVKPTNPTKDTTVAVKFDTLIAFFTWTGQAWVLEYTFEIPTPSSIQESYIDNITYNGSLLTFNGVGDAFSGTIKLPKKWCGRITDKQHGTKTLLPYNDNSPDYFGDITVTNRVGSLYLIQTPPNALLGVNQIVYTGSANFDIETNIVSSNVFFIAINPPTILNNHHLCFEFFYAN